MAEPTQRALFPGGRRPWSWLVTTFKKEDRELAQEVLEADWSEIERKAREYRREQRGNTVWNEHVGEMTIRIAHRYVARAKKHPESLAWSRARNARKREAAAEPLRQNTEDLVTALLGEKERGRKW